MAKQSAPGKSYRKGITLIEAVTKFATVEQAEEWFVEQRWPNSIACPRCGSDNIMSRPNRKPMPLRCKACWKDFSVTSGTLLHRSKIPLNKWAIAFYLYSTNLKGVSSLKLSRDLDITQKSAWYMGHRIRESWNAAADQFAGPVEADETYIGGKEGNKHASKKLHAGGGAVGKTAVVGVKDRATNRVNAQVVAATDAPTSQEFVQSHTADAAMVYTDEARPHEAVKRSVGEYVREMAHTNGIESFWATLKRGHDGVYHHFSVKRLDMYVTEFEGRHNFRPLDTAEQMAELARGAVGKRLPYSDLIAEPND